MIAPRWRKVLRELFERRGRSALLVLAMGAGVFEISAMLYKYALLQPELTQMYGRTRPASATLTLDRMSDALVDSVRRVPGVAAAEARPVILARARVGEDEWVPAMLQVVRDFDDQHVDTFVRSAGAWPPADGEVVLERTALQVAKASLGDTVVMRPAGGEERSVRIAGTVHAAGLAPAWMEHAVTGFVGWSSVLRGGEGELAQIRIVVADHPFDEGYIHEVADSVKARLERCGVTVSRVTVPPPGRHPHADQMEAFLFLLLSFGVLSYALSLVLIASLVHALMSEQVRQIGVMKAIGATSRQIAGVYLGYVGALAAGALVVGLPSGLVVGQAYAKFAAGILNTDISQRPFPVWLVLAEAAAGIVLPLLVALGPVARASRITVQQALSDDPPVAVEARGLARWLSRTRGLPRPLALTLRSTFARRGRLALTVLLLACGGAAFMSALNVSGAWTRAVNEDFRRRRYDLTLILDEARPLPEIERVLASVPEVAHSEFWPGATPYLVGASGVAGSPVALVGPEPESRLLDPAMSEGRWLRPGDRRVAIVNRAVMTRSPGLAVGDSVRVRVRGRDAAFAIVGVARELAPMPVVYAPASAVREVTGQSASEARSVRIVTRRHDDAGQRAAARALERAFDRAGIPIGALQRTEDARRGILDHLVIIMTVLTMAALVVVTVGSLGLASTMWLSVIQRTREIGILGAIGARPRTIAGHIWLEAVVIGAISWLAALVLAAPISGALESVVGEIFFKTPLEFYLSGGAAAVWLALVIVLASICSFYPARRAARLTVREALSQS